MSIDRLMLHTNIFGIMGSLIFTRRDDDTKNREKMCLT
jgi:hypothetical protein